MIIRERQLVKSQFFLGNSFSTKNKYPDQANHRDIPKKRMKISKITCIGIEVMRRQDDQEHFATNFMQLLPQMIFATIITSGQSQMNPSGCLQLFCRMGPTMSRLNSSVNHGKTNNYSSSYSISDSSSNNRAWTHQPNRRLVTRT